MRRRHRRQIATAPLSAFAGFRFPPEVIMLAVRWYLPYELSGTVALSLPGGHRRTMRRRRRSPIPPPHVSAFSGFRFPPEVIMVAVRWYLRYGLSYRDLEELLDERGIEVDHVTLFRWVQRFTPLLIDAARPCRRAVGGRWFVDETYVKIAGVWRYVYRAVDEDGQVLDVFVSKRRDAAAAEWFFAKALRDHGEPGEIVTDKSPVLASVIADLVPAAEHCTDQYANNRIEADHGRLKARVKPMRGLKRDRTASVVVRGHAFVQNLRRGHYTSATTSTECTGSKPPSTISCSRSAERQFATRRSSRAPIRTTQHRPPASC